MMSPLGGTASFYYLRKMSCIATLIDKTIYITDLEGTSYDSGYVAFEISQNAQVVR